MGGVLKSTEAGRSQIAEDSEERDAFLGLECESPISVEEPRW